MVCETGVAVRLMRLVRQVQLVKLVRQVGLVKTGETGVKEMGREGDLGEKSFLRHAAVK